MNGAGLLTAPFPVPTVRRILPVVPLIAKTARPPLSGMAQYPVSLGIDAEHTETLTSWQAASVARLVVPCRKCLEHPVNLFGAQLAPLICIMKCSLAPGRQHASLLARVLTVYNGSKKRRDRTRDPTPTTAHPPPAATATQSSEGRGETGDEAGGNNVSSV